MDLNEWREAAIRREQQRQLEQRKQEKGLYGDIRGAGLGSAEFGKQGEAGFGRLGAESDAYRKQLGDIASGRVSLSGEQLRQGLQQNLAAQRSMAASAAPQNAAMAARTAMIQGGRAASGLAGQQALAGIAERQAATQSLGNFLGQQRQQELQAALSGRGQALGAFGSILNDQTQRELRKEDENGGIGAGNVIGGIGGAAIGGYFGGPTGAALGGQLGSQAGGLF